MFGRRIDVFIANDKGEAIQLVDHTKKEYTLRCDGEIERNPSTEVTSMILSIYNLDGDTRNQIKSGEYKYITVKFGYEDSDSGELSELFMGTLQRMITQRPDSATSVTKFFVWDTGDLKRFGFFSGAFMPDTSFYDIVQYIAKNSDVEIKVMCSENLKKYCITSAVSFYDSIENIFQEIASQANMLYYVNSGTVHIVDQEENQLTEVFMYSKVDEKGSIESASGLVSIPTLSNDGMYFEALVNPRLRMYSIVLMANSLISNAQEGFIPEAELGATFDSNGLYRVVKINIKFTNGPGECLMNVKTLARDSYSELV